MNAKLLILLVLVVGIFLIGCSQSPSGNYAAYNQPQQGQQGQYVGGGCGVAPSADYEDTPIEALGIINSQL